MSNVTRILLHGNLDLTKCQRTGEIDSLYPRHSHSNPIELNLNRTQRNSTELNPWIEFGNRMTHKKIGQSNSIERSISELLILVLKINDKFLECSSYFSITRFYCNCRTLAEMASDALWVVSFNA